MLLQTKNVHIGYKNKKEVTTIVKNININESNPNFIALIGRNGAGKSTLIRTLAGIQPAIQGEVFISDKNISDYNALELSKKISLVLTEKIPPSNLTVIEVVSLSRQMYTDWLGKLTEKDIKIIDKALQSCNVLDLKNNFIDELSDGQYQKVMLARALAQDTPIIFLDEPTAHLDIVNRVEIFKLLHNISLKKLVITSTHEIQLCLKYTNSLWLMHNGELIHDSKKNILKKNLLHKLFDSDLIKFDSKTEKFIFN